MSGAVLVVDDRDGIRQFLKETVSRMGFDVQAAADGVLAKKALEENRFDVVVTDLKMPGMDGMALLQFCNTRPTPPRVIVLTAHGTIDNAVTAMKCGAFDYLTKPLESPEQLRQVVRRAMESSVSDHCESGVVATAPAMVQLMARIDKVAPRTVSVLLLGESGSGKEVMARELHQRSGLEGPFVAVNCAAISPTLMESEMFGHVKGAYTDATANRAGRFETAQNGTLFLDEVGELPLALQAKLLRVLQEGVVTPVGSNKDIPVNARVVAATNRNLEKMIGIGQFREDLYHRLAVFPLRIPPLRDRRQDIAPLCNHLLAQINRREKSHITISADAIETLTHYPFPGNVRELANLLSRAAILSEGNQIKPDDLEFDQHSPSGDDQSQRSGVNAITLAETERAAIVNALRTTGGHRKKAAALLGIGLRTLYTKIKEYGID